MLRRRQVPPGSERHALEVIERNALAQARLVEDLLDISRAVAGRLRLELSDVNLAATLRAAADAVRPAAATQGVVLDLEVPDDLGVIRGDPARLLQVLQNLLSNAIKFTTNGGRVSLEASRAGQGLDPGEGHGHRDQRGIHPVRLRSVPSRHFDHQGARRRRPWARDRAVSDRASRRDDRRGERRGGSGSTFTVLSHRAGGAARGRCVIAVSSGRIGRRRRAPIAA